MPSVPSRWPRRNSDATPEVLKKQVQERTREINSILRYTPDVVSIKDGDGYYTLINTCFEQILGRSNEAVQGLRDDDLFPEEVARQFRQNDLKVLRERRSFQFEEQMPHRDGTMHYYLSVKFPFFGEDGEASGVLRNIHRYYRCQKSPESAPQALGQYYGRPGKGTGGHCAGTCTTNWDKC